MPLLGSTRQVFLSHGVGRVRAYALSPIVDNSPQREGTTLIEGGAEE